MAGESVGKRLTVEPGGDGREEGKNRRLSLKNNIFTESRALYHFEYFEPSLSFCVQEKHSGERRHQPLQSTCGTACGPPPTRQQPVTAVSPFRVACCLRHGGRCPRQMSGLGRSPCALECVHSLTQVVHAAALFRLSRRPFLL